MKKLTWLTFLFFCLSAGAQDKGMADSLSSKKVLLHFDKGSYYPGDTVFFKAYLYSDFTLDQSTTNLFVSLYKESGDRIVQKRFPVLSGLCYGNLELADSLDHGFYVLQVLTPAQLISGDSIGYLRQLLVVNPSRVPASYRRTAPPAYSILFLPSGGNLVEGLSNQVDFIARDQYGNAVPVKGRITDGQDNSVAEFGADEGKGSFFFLPANTNYKARLIFNGTVEQVVDLPPVKSAGVTIRVTGNGQNRSCLVETNLNKPVELELWGMMNESPVIQQPLDKNQSHIIKIPVDKLPSGTLHLAVADKEGNIHAQTTCFVDNKEYLKKVELLTKEFNLEPGADNELIFDLKDSLWAGLSLSIVDPEKAEPLWSSAGNIIEDALVNNEKPGPWSAAWKQSDWKRIFLERDEKQIPGDFISITGTVYKEGTKKPVTTGQVNFLITTKDSSSTLMFVPVDEQGKIALNNLVFEDTAIFAYQMNKGKGGPITIELDKPDYHLPSKLPAIEIPLLNHDRAIISDTTRQNPLVLRFQEINPELEKFKTLQEVTVVAARKRNPTVLVNQRYTSGLFANLSQAKVMDFINDPPTGGGNVFDYIASKLPGVRIRKQGLDYILESPRALSIGNMTMGGNGLVDGVFYLNEVEVQSRDISFLPLSDIALVKYFPPGTSIIANGSIAPVLAIYTKQHEDQQSSFRGMSRFRYPGYSPSDLIYDESFNQYYKGNKGVILWKPDLYLAGESNQLSVKFSSPYKLKRVRVILQGVTLDGELIYFEKTLSADLN